MEIAIYLGDSRGNIPGQRILVPREIFDSTFIDFGRLQRTDWMRIPNNQLVTAFQNPYGQGVYRVTSVIYDPAGVTPTITRIRYVIAPNVGDPWIDAVPLRSGETIAFVVVSAVREMKKPKYLKPTKHLKKKLNSKKEK